MKQMSRQGVHCTGMIMKMKMAQHENEKDENHKDKKSRPKSGTSSKVVSDSESMKSLE